jgi:hypothetical protein
MDLLGMPNVDLEQRAIDAALTPDEPEVEPEPDAPDDGEPDDAEDDDATPDDDVDPNPDDEDE